MHIERPLSCIQCITNWAMIYYLNLGKKKPMGAKAMGLKLNLNHYSNLAN